MYSQARILHTTYTNPIRYSDHHELNHSFILVAFHKLAIHHSQFIIFLYTTQRYSITQDYEAHRA